MSAFSGRFVCLQDVFPCGTVGCLGNTVVTVLQKKNENL